MLTKHFNIFTGRKSLKGIVKGCCHFLPRALRYTQRDLWADLSTPLADQRSALGRAVTLTLGMSCEVAKSKAF